MKSNALIKFYDQYHQQNQNYSGVIGDGNFTYFYIIRFLQKACKKQFAHKRVLDVGCGVGSLSFYLASKRAEVMGVDISRRAIDIARQAKKQNGLDKQVEFHQGKIEKITGKFDIVVCSEVIEHIEDDKRFLSELKKRLKKNGLLVLTTPSKENCLFKSGYYQKFDQQVGHLRRYTKKSLTALFEKEKLNVIQLIEVEGPLRNILFTSKLGFVIKFIKGPLVPIFHWFDRISGLMFGFSDLQIVARKR